jgi:hypothetical protein
VSLADISVCLRYGLCQQPCAVDWRLIRQWGSAVTHERPQQAAIKGHEQSRSHPLIGHVAQEEAQPAVGEAKHIVKVPGHLASCLEMGRYPPPAYFWKLPWQETGLNLMADLELSLQALQMQLLQVVQSLAD